MISSGCLRCRRQWDTNEGNEDDGDDGDDGCVAFAPMLGLGIRGLFLGHKFKWESGIIAFMVVVMMMITVVVTMKAIMILSDNDKILGISIRPNSDHCLVLSVHQ